MKATVSVSGAAGTATGAAELGRIVDGTFKVIATGVLSNGSVTFKYVPVKAGTYYLQARYGGNTAYNTATSAEVKLKVTKAHR